MTTTAEHPAVFDPKDLARIENLELLASRVVDGLLSGKHRSELKGGSAEFTEHRGYVPGDEIRLIDWKVYGKSDRYFIKQYIEQTCLQVIVVADGSGSMAFGLDGGSKFQYARAVAACLTRLVLRQRDSAGLAVLGKTLRNYIPPRANPNHFQALLELLRVARPSGETALADNLTELTRRIKRRGLIVLLSDCFDEIDSLRQAFQFLRARGHEIILLHTMAPEELTFDFGGWSRFECLEVINRHLDLDPALIRREYVENVRKFLADLKRICGETGTDYHPLPTNKPMGEALAYYLKRRSARLKQT
ncbi:MAG: DUF58 domain-containing protein [Verrucomicrobia subdivision 3 bacterium]|nr:DUF58 domain-containing protein [Limisphaerales bacterium]